MGKRRRNVDTKRAQAPRLRQAAPGKKELFFLRGRGSRFHARRAGETRFGHLAGAETLREFFDAPGGVDEFLLAGEKGMTGRANTKAEILFGGAGVIDRAAGADDLAFHIFGVDIGFHGSWEKYLNSPAEQAPNPGAVQDLVAALGRIEKIRDRAENDHNPRAQERHDGNHDNGDNGENKGVFHQRLSFSAQAARANPRPKRFNDGSHLRKVAEITGEKLHQRDGFDNEREIEHRDQADKVSARDLRE